jgi:hypothetical protein
LSDTRPTLTEEEFERYAAHRAPNWWMVGENLAFAPEVRAVEGYHRPGSPGNLMLMPAQRDLLVWIEIIREAATSCISDFFEERRAMLADAERVVQRLGWPEFERNYMAAAHAYMGICGKWVSAEEWRQEERDHWERLREEAKHIQRKNGHKPDTGEDLDRAVMRMQVSGLIPMPKRRTHANLNHFNEWFRREETKVASERYVGAFIRRHRDELARIKE